MRWFVRLRRWERAMEDVEDPRGIEFRELRDRVRALEAQQTERAAVAGASGR
jgi:hypothetical protein